MAASAAALFRFGGKGALRSGILRVAGVGGHDLPSTVTWQEHSAWPALFLATHLYKPLSSGSAFSMETEHSEPGREEEHLLSGPDLSPTPAGHLEHQSECYSHAQKSEALWEPTRSPHQSQGTFC